MTSAMIRCVLSRQHINGPGLCRRIHFAFEQTVRCCRGMLSHFPLPAGFVEPCIPTFSRTVPDGPRWAYEIKRDGFRFICRRDGDPVRIHSRWGKEWAAKVPAILEAL